MNYELAKQLKDAGFPIKMFEVCSVEHECRCDKPDCKLEILSKPTLSKLIEACNKNDTCNYDDEDRHRFRVLSFDNEIYKAEGFRGCQDYYAETIGSTPEEAVAKLWLELNK